MAMEKTIIESYLREVSTEYFIEIRESANRKAGVHKPRVRLILLRKQRDKIRRFNEQLAQTEIQQRLSYWSLHIPPDNSHWPI